MSEKGEKKNGANKYQSVSKTEFGEVFALRPNRYGETPWPATIGKHSLFEPDPRAHFAMVCMERWGMICAAPDGEDTAGRQQLRVLSAAEIVEKACSVAEEAFSQFKTRGWLTPIPTIQELADLVKDQENSND